MAKKKEAKRNKIQKVSEIDRIPKCWKQPRSTGGPRRRRTDFSLFFCSSSSSLSYSPLGVLLESLRGKDKSGCDTITDSEETRKKREEILQFPAVQCCDFEDLRQESFSNFTGVPVIEVEQVNQNAPFDSWSGRNAEKQECDTVGKLEFTPEKSQITESTSLCKTPGSSVGDKTACQLWSAEALDSPCFSKEFIESSDDPNCSIQRDQSPDKWNSSSSSRTESDCVERRRGTRERKPKVHFDEVTFPLRSMTKGRRYRIMRILGLAAPVGSPFQ
ncbi:hypothetical protein Vadar_009622 [Vaccinium darrowii]|uniref:Uncharacterized protein n=1 Tax=Vaccinium darrowii TaxID=229202 RepID=A0ACB7XPK6_9ERIC|nr:hypothetical protein Vadar_009622 [Vaccinium darrowii]